MTDKHHPFTQNPKPNRTPITDTDRNGKLGGYDILAHLETDRKANDSPIRYLLNVAKIKAHASAYRQTEFTLGAAKPSIYADNLGRSIQNAIDDFLENINRNPNFLNEQIAKIDKHELNTSIKIRTKENLEDFAKFALNFRKNFPNGVQIEPETVYTILNVTNPEITTAHPAIPPQRVSNQL
jgi:hypothetical protein